MTDSPSHEMTQLASKLDELSHLNQSEYESKKTADIFQYFDKVYTTSYGTKTFQTLIDTLVQRKYAKSCSSIFSKLHTDVFENEQRWHVVYYLLHSIWNLTDQNPEICWNVVENQFVPMLVFNLKNENYLKHFSSNEGIRKLFEMIVSILHNIAQVPELSTELRRAQCVDTLNNLMSIVTSQSMFLKGISHLTMAYLIREDERSYLKNSAEIIPYLVKLLTEAVTDEDRRGNGLQTVELCRGLSKLSVANENKFKIYSESKLINSLLNMLEQHGQFDEQISACTLIWNLIFDEKVRKAYNENGKLCQILTKIAQTSSNDSLRRSASGCLCTMMGGPGMNQAKKTSSVSNASDRSVMISYNHDAKQICKQIKDHLSADGYRVWIDLESMHGNLLDAMADAIETSSIFIMCLTEKYRDSPSCRSECEYAYQRKKYIIPILLQPNYKPDGWLGIVLGTKIYINYAKKPFNTAYAETVAELNLAISKIEKKPTTVETKKAVSPPEPVKPANSSRLDNSSPGALSNLMAQLRMEKPSEIKTVSYANWEKLSITDTQTLLANNGLEKFMSMFMEMDGQKLSKLFEIRTKASQCYYMLLKDRWDQINLPKDQSRDNVSPVRTMNASNTMAQFLQFTITLDRLADRLASQEST